MGPKAAQKSGKNSICLRYIPGVLKTESLILLRAPGGLGSESTLGYSGLFSRGRGGTVKASSQQLWEGGMGQHTCRLVFVYVPSLSSTL